MGKMSRHLNEVVNQTWNFSKRLTTPQDHEQNAMVGLASEAGEVLDVGKKRWFHTPKDRRDELRSELGDVIYYWLKTLDVFGFTIEEVLADNRAKLMARYPEFFADNKFCCVIGCDNIVTDHNAYCNECWDELEDM